MKKSLVLLLAGIMIIPVAVVMAQRGGQTLNLPTGDAKRGEAAYMKYGCWECHGYTGQTGNGARLATTALNANGFVNYVRNPRTNQMPLYSEKVVSNQDGADLFAYIKTFKKPPEAKDIPLLQQIINEK